MTKTAPVAYDRLMEWSRHGDSADAGALGRMLLHRCSGATAPYPRALGLDPGTLTALVTAYFPAAAIGWQPGTCFSRHVHRLVQTDAAEHPPSPFPAVMADHDIFRLMREESDFLGLLLRHRSGDHAATPAFAVIIARACVENDHLWRSLGLVDREPLADLLSRHFHPLVSTNIRKLRWKRFFYDRLYADGRPTDRTTVCDVCSHRPGCYGEASRSPSPRGEHSFPEGAVTERVTA